MCWKVRLTKVPDIICEGDLFRCRRHHIACSVDRRFLHTQQTLHSAFRQVDNKRRRFDQRQDEQLLGRVRWYCNSIECCCRSLFQARSVIRFTSMYSFEHLTVKVINCIANDVSEVVIFESRGNFFSSNINLFSVIYGESHG